MRIVLVAATLVSATFFAAAPSQAAHLQGPVDYFFFPDRPDNGRWCARSNAGADWVRNDCSFATFEACRQEITGGNRGFCSPNPSWRPSAERPRPRRHRASAIR